MQLVTLARDDGVDLVVVEEREGGEDEAVLGSEKREGVAGVEVGAEGLELGQLRSERGSRVGRKRSGRESRRGSEERAQESADGS